MSYNTLHIPYTVFPSTPTFNFDYTSSFSLFSQSPRDRHAVCEDLRQVLRPLNRHFDRKTRRRIGGRSVNSGLRKMMNVV